MPTPQRTAFNERHFAELVQLGRSQFIHDFQIAPRHDDILDEFLDYAREHVERPRNEALIETATQQLRRLRDEQDHLNAVSQAMARILTPKLRVGKVTDNNAQHLCKRCGTRHTHRDPCVGVEEPQRANGILATARSHDDVPDAISTLIGYIQGAATSAENIAPPPRPIEPYWAVI